MLWKLLICTSRCLIYNTAAYVQRPIVSVTKHALSSMTACLCSTATLTGSTDTDAASRALCSSFKVLILLLLCLHVYIVHRPKVNDTALSESNPFGDMTFIERAEADLERRRGRHGFLNQTERIQQQQHSREDMRSRSMQF
jgi:hypothetical protein